MARKKKPRLSGPAAWADKRQSWFNSDALLDHLWATGDRGQALDSAKKLAAQWAASDDPILQAAAQNLLAKWAPREKELTAAQGGAPAPAPEGPSVQPFHDSDGLREINSFLTDWSMQNEELDRGLADLKTQTEYEQTVNERTAVQNKASATEAASGRGLFQSSIKDAAIYDIEATRALQQKFLNDRLTTAELSANERRRILNSGKEEFEKAMALKAVENAREISRNMPAGAAPPPAAGQAPPPAPAPAPAAAPPASVPKGRPAPNPPQPTGGASARPIPAGLRQPSPPRPRPRRPARPRRPRYPAGTTFDSTR